MAKVLGKRLLAVCGICLLLTVAARAEEKGLAGYWKFDEGQGTIAKDSSGKGNDGKLANAEYVAFKNGFALKFNGVGSCVTVANSPALSIGTNSFTVMAWVNIAVVPKQWQNIVDKRLNKGGKGFDFEISDAGYPAIEVNDGNYGTSSGKVKVPADTWCHLAVVCDRDTDTVFYLNGKPAGIGDLSSRSGDLDGTADVVIGSIKPYPVTGLIDEVRIYTRALPADEIAKIFAGSKP